MTKEFSLGIDLGTSNSALALYSKGSEQIEVLPITQVLSPDTIGERETFASALYLPSRNEFSPSSFRLPWNGAEEAWCVAGSFARERGALAPDRLALSAKSWLCNQHIDRKEPVLPWKSELVERKVSPFEATRIYLSHLKNAFEETRKKSGAPLSPADCEVVLTVPASFDEIARSLTHAAALEAGFDKVTLLEEPQAAFYAWLEAENQTWRSQVSAGDLILVCDVGGGTTDFSLIVVSDQNGILELRRISVGDHILLGGDNMDLALAHALRADLEAQHTTLDHWQFLSLVHSCRGAKEKLLVEGGVDSLPVSVPTRGSSLFAKTISSSISRQLAEQIILDGFFPLSSIEEQPVVRRAAGLQELGLNFAPDAAISRHLARFLTRSLENAKSDPSLFELVAKRTDSRHSAYLAPDAVLFNGGVFKAAVLRARVLELLGLWAGGQAPRELRGARFDLAVAKGAAQYGRILSSGSGIRIRAGTARSYYLGLESSTPAVPGYTPSISGLCIVPQGMEEGSELCLEKKDFGLVTGEPVQFRFFASAVRAGDTIGTLVPDAETTLEELSGLEVTLPSLSDEGGDVVPVRLHSVVTATGTLELWMRHLHSDQKWKLEFNLRAQPQ
ncbi:MAG: Hsp70 family protein [Deltaproteobacteria bacterium]|nr:Hsp70 family protein [Deltaproteobacteria bacterium]